ncbi:MAG: leucine--tRNA ligase [Magnetococcales bacterium]|nr:leucine--tRNA ligase [Magnetococcales bacterium]
MNKYNPQAIEAKWQAVWEREQLFRATEETERDRNFYLLVMFPYPSGRIHIGHVRNYAIGDLIARYQRLRGRNVLHPMGWDAFGMPAENAAAKQGVHPADWTWRNIDTMRRELKSMGLSYDWSREFATCDPRYAHWEQQLFLRLYQRGLVYRRSALVNWDPVDQTVLANEQVIDGKGWRSGAPIERRELWQWFLRITAYSDELLADLNSLTGWPDAVRTMQTNWIGRSHGVEFSFAIEGRSERLSVYTTRPDTLMGVTFCSIAAEHPLARLVAAHDAGAEAFIRECQCAGTSEEAVERMEKRGYDTGLKAIHPLTSARVPIFIANFVLMNYGTGAVMAVPAHDQRDFDFARHYRLPVQVVIQPSGQPLNGEQMTEAWTGAGVLVNSGPFTGLDHESAKQKIAATLVQLGIGKELVNYRLRDWGISRQRYWGNPIPMIHCPRCGVLPVPESMLPVALPNDVDLTGIGNPLERHPTWKHVSCPSCGEASLRETDTMDTFVESSWYFLRYCCPHLEDAALDRRLVDYWMPVNQYVGGIEHAVLHLLYARFFHKALRDLGEVTCNEPFTRLLTQGMVRKDTYRCPDHGWRYPADVVEQDGRLLCRTCQSVIEVGRNEKMSKSKFNIVDPNDLIAGYGADTARLFMLFAAPPERDLEWNDSGIDGAWRFLNRLWRLVHDMIDVIGCVPEVDGSVAVAAMDDDGLRQLRRKTHATIDKVSLDMERQQFNTGIAAVMELVGEGQHYLAAHTGQLGTAAKAVLRELAESAVILLNPYAPHITEELWRVLGHTTHLCRHRWPVADPEALRCQEMTIVVQVNGKLRTRLVVPVDLSQQELQAAAQADDRVRPWIADKSVRQVIVVPGRLVNIVVG